jgi:hypothetical protein
MALAARPTLSTVEVLYATPPKLSSVELRAAELETMRAHRLRYDVVSRLLFGFIDLVSGRAGACASSEPSRCWPGCRPTT